MKRSEQEILEAHARVASGEATQADIGREWGVSRERVRQIFASRGLGTYLHYHPAHLCHPSAVTYWAIRRGISDLVSQR
jgi:hypothetical protein